MRIDLMGQRFGRLVVIGFAGKEKHRQLRWECLCDCGNSKNVRSGGRESTVLKTIRYGKG